MVILRRTPIANAYVWQPVLLCHLLPPISIRPPFPSITCPRPHATPEKRSATPVAEIRKRDASPVKEPTHPWGCFGALVDFCR